MVFDKISPDDEKDEFLLGYIPRSEKGTISQLLQMGWNNIFECRISRINPEAHYEEQVHLTIRIKRNEKEEYSNL